MKTNYPFKSYQNTIPYTVFLARNTSLVKMHDTNSLLTRSESFYHGFKREGFNHYKEEIKPPTVDSVLPLPSPQSIRPKKRSYKTEGKIL